MIVETLPITDTIHIGLWIATSYIAFAILALIPIIRKRKQGPQSINKAFMIWLIFLLGMTMIRFTDYIIIMDNNLPEGAFSLGASLGPWDVIPMLSILAELQFVLYIFRKNKIYSIPTILAFFLSLGLFQYSNKIVYDIVVVPIAVLNAGLFLWKGSKNRDGLIYAIGISSLFDFFIAFLINSIFKNVLDFSGEILYLPMFFSALFAVIYLNFGTWGWLDRHVFYDKEREKKIKSAWIGSLIEIEKKKPEVKKNGGKSIILECPICHVQGKKVFPHETVLERANNTKGIVKMLLNEDKEICEHTFVAFVDRNFSIRGYESIDMKV